MRHLISVGANNIKRHGERSFTVAFLLGLICINLMFRKALDQ